MAEDIESIQTPSNDHADQMESALEAVLGPEDAPDVEADDQPMDEEPDAPEAPDAEPADEMDETDEEPAAPVDARADVTKAIGVLRRDNVPDDVIDSLMTNPAKLLAWAEKAGKRQRDIDERMRGSKAEPEAKDTPENPKADPTGQPAHDPDLAELVRPFAEEMGSEHATETLTRFAEHIQRTTLDKVLPGLQGLSTMVETILVERARDGLRERFPQVADEGNWSKIQERAMLLSKSGGYSDPATLFRDAARIEFGETNVKDFQTNLAKKHSHRSLGTPTPPRQTRRAAPRTHADAIDAALDAVLGPPDPA